MTGKPYSGKLNVRFDEGELEIGHLPLRQFSTLPLLSLSDDALFNKGGSENKKESKGKAKEIENEDKFLQ